MSLLKYLFIAKVSYCIYNSWYLYQFHCIGGRGRAVTITLCWLLYYHIVILRDTEFTVSKGMDIIKRGRSCAVAAVGKYKVVSKCFDYCKSIAPKSDARDVQ